MILRQDDPSQPTFASEFTPLLSIGDETQKQNPTNAENHNASSTLDLTTRTLEAAHQPHQQPHLPSAKPRSKTSLLPNTPSLPPLILSALPFVYAQSTDSSNQPSAICSQIAKPSNIVLLAAGLIANCAELPSIVLTDQPHCGLAGVLGLLMLGVYNVVWGYRMLTDPNRYMRIHRAVAEHALHGLLRQVDVLSSIGRRNSWIARWVGKMRVLWRVVNACPSARGRVKGTALHFMYAREKRARKLQRERERNGRKGGWDRIVRGNIWKPELAAVSEMKLRPLLNRYGGVGNKWVRFFRPFLPLVVYAVILGLGLYVCELCNFSSWLRGVLAAILGSGILKWLGAIMLRYSFAYAVSTVVVDQAHGNSNGFGARRRFLLRGAGFLWLVAGLVDWGYLLVTGTLDDAEMNVVIAIIAVQAFIQLAAQHIAEPNEDILGDTDWSDKALKGAKISVTEDASSDRKIVIKTR
ncbi:hypothetical protein HDV00_004690 [Rhizophlyctis rosea]|nr:hypothetical protein HDV00_004690 [Rhizophlyctis rosea]